LIPTGLESIYTNFTFLPQLSNAYLHFEPEAGYENKISLNTIEKQGDFPVRHKMKDNFLFTLCFAGGVYYYERGLTTWNARGLLYQIEQPCICTGLVVPSHFNVYSQNVEDRYLFFTYYYYANEENPIHKVRRVEFNQNLQVVSELDIWQVVSGPVVGFHQIMDGYESDRNVYFVVGDFNEPSDTWKLDKPNGKLWKVDYDGNNPTIVAKGMRNPYGMKRINKNNDSLERWWFSANGNEKARTYFVTIEAPEGQPTATGDDMIDMGWGYTGEGRGEKTTSWSYIEDKNNPRNPKPNSILYSWDLDPSPNGLDTFDMDCPIHSRNTILEKGSSDSIVSGMLTCLGRGYDPNGDVDPIYDRRVCMVSIDNLTGAQPAINITPVLKWVNDGGNHGPQGMCIDQQTGQVIFSDMHHNEVYVLSFHDI
jgi:hypothetical protein